MKYTFVCFFFLLFTLLPFSSVLGQFNFGVKAGMNMGDIKVRSKTLLVEEQYAPLRLWHFGAVANVGFTDCLSGQIEILFNQKGGQSPIDLGMPNPLEVYWQYKLTYLSFPVLLQHKFGPISIEAGPEIGYLFKLKTLRNDIQVNNSMSFFGEEKLDFSLNAGFRFAVQKVFAEVRWSRSMLSVGNITVTDLSGEIIGYYKHYPTTLEVSIGYLFYSGEKNKTGNDVSK